jgi:hypothetical protein
MVVLGARHDRSEVESWLWGEPVMVVLGTLPRGHAASGPLTLSHSFFSRVASSVGIGIERSRAACGRAGALSPNQSKESR